MPIAKRLAASVIAAALIGGCASSGGGGKATATYSDGSTRELTMQEFFACLITMGLVCPRSPNSSTTTSSSSASDESTYYESSTARTQDSAIAAPSPAPFSRWQDHLGGNGATARTLGETATINRSPEGGSGHMIVAVGASDGGEITVLYDAAGALSELRMHDRSLFPRADAGSPAGFPEIDMAWAESNASQTVFADVQSDTSALIANPYALGWSYQSFGVWNSPDLAVQERVFAVSYGAATPGAAVPATGSAAYTGKLAGLLVQPNSADYMVAANVSVQVDFGRRSVSLASSGTSIMRDSARASAAPHLDLAGTMTYAPDSNTFTGGLTTADARMRGSSSGRFYGPAAEELGGAFIVRSQDGAGITGAYGAKR